MKESTRAGRYAIHLDFEGCKACGYCRLVCPKGVYRQGTAFNRRGFKPFQATGAESCVGCMRCFHVCPDFCLDLTLTSS